ncbi:MAG: FtsX-like permease family protein [Alphaproteobacteria bacterium]|nr:FtsX-like permease family protein [Alphaproteobacteria bacterium]
MTGPATLPRLAGYGAALPLLVAVMAFVAQLALAGGLALNTALANWHAELAGRLTIELPAAAPGERLEEALALARATPGVRTAAALPKAEVSKLLEPWLGKRGLADRLPLPTLIDVALDTPSAEVAKTLATRLAGAMPEAVLDDHRLWFGHWVVLLHWLQFIAAGVVLLAVAAGALVVAIATRALLAAERGTVEILHLLGARDWQIARPFQREALQRAGLGSLAGLALASLALLLVGHLLARADSPILAGRLLSWRDCGWLAATAAAFAGVAMLAARATVLGDLRRLP